MSIHRSPEPAVITAEDLVLALRLSRSTACGLLRRAGAVRIGALLRLPASRLPDAVGAELAEIVIARLSALSESES